VQRPDKDLDDALRLLSTVGADGTIHLKDRAIPLPKSLSEEAAAWYRARFREFADRGRLADHQVQTAQEIFAASNRFNDLIDAQWLRAYPANIERDRKIADVRTDIVSPVAGELPARRALINIFPGMGIYGDSQSHEGIVVCNLMRTPVYIPRYRTMPEHSGFDGLEDVCAVYKELLNEYPAANIGVFGSCSGGFMAMQLVVRMLQEGLPVPGAIALLTVTLDIEGDSNVINEGLYPDPLLLLQFRDVERDLEGRIQEPPTDPNSPVASPVRSSLRRFPPTLLIAGGRDRRCSGATLNHRAMRRAGADADLFIFDGMFHFFHRIFDFPESKELFDIVTRFFHAKLGSA
jgi:epsilon-lactone hydrolase